MPTTIPMHANAPVPPGYAAWRLGASVTVLPAPNRGAAWSADRLRLSPVA